MRLMFCATCAVTWTSQHAWTTPSVSLALLAPTIARRAHSPKHLDSLAILRNSRAWQFPRHGDGFSSGLVPTNNNRSEHWMERGGRDT